MSEPPTIEPSLTPAPARWTWGRALRLAIGPVILLVLFLTADLAALAEAFSRTQPLYLVLAGAVVLPTLLLRAWRWHILLGPKLRPSRFVDVVVVYAYAIFIGIVTPGRVGEFVKVVHVTRWGAPTVVAIVKVLVDRLFDVLALLVAGVFGLWFIGAAGIDTQPLVLGSTALLVVIGVATWWGFRDMRRGGGLSRLIARLAPVRLRAPLSQLRAELLAERPRGSLLVYGGAATLTLGAWALNFLANYYVAAALGLELTYIQVVTVSAISSLVTLVPITVLGAGTRDAALIALLAPLGATRAQALAFSTLLLSLLLWLGLVCAPTMLSSAARWRARAQEP